MFCWGCNGNTGLGGASSAETAAYAKPLGTEKFLPMTFTARLLVPSPAHLGCCRSGMSKSLRANPADVVGDPKPVLCCKALR